MEPALWLQVHAAYSRPRNTQIHSFVVSGRALSPSFRHRHRAQDGPDRQASAGSVLTHSFIYRSADTNRPTSVCRRSGAHPAGTVKPQDSSVRIGGTPDPYGEGAPYSCAIKGTVKLTRLKILVISGVAALAVAGTGTALAAVSGPVSSSGVVSGCYSSRAVHGSHTLILQDQGTGCPAGTKALSWNQAGTQGPAGTQGAAGVSGLQIETCNTGQLFGFQAPGAGTLNPLCSKVDASGGGITRAYAELDCPQGKVAISAAWGGWDGAYGSTGQGLSPLSTGISGAIRDVTLTDNGRGYVFTADGSWPPLLYVTCATAS